MMRTSGIRRPFLVTLTCLLTVGSVRFASAQTTDVVTYYHTDAIGSVRMITDANGQVIARYDYLPFGEPCNSACGTPSAPDARQFSGKERDAETGFDYFGGRYYLSSSGRFTTVDPVLDVQQAIVNPQEWNRYSSVTNNPLRRVDPDGRQGIDANVARMLELLRAPRTLAGNVRGPVIQTAVDAAVNTLLGELFGYNPNAVRGGLSMAEFEQLNQASAYEKGALMLGVGEKNAPAIDAVDLTHQTGVSLKTAANANRVLENAQVALDQVTNAQFYNVNLYIDAKTVRKKDINEARIKGFVNDRITKIVIFTNDGTLEYSRQEP